MPEWISLVLLTLVAGMAIPVGGVLARIESIRPDWLENEVRHGVIAFGGGVLLAAVALVLVPDGMAKLAVIPVILAFLAGCGAFLALDWFLAQQSSSSGQLVAMLADFIPEAMALGAGFATGAKTGLLLAILIGLQNVPEGFNAYRELKSGGDSSPKNILGKFVGIGLLGPVAGLLGYYWLSDHPQILGGVVIFASAGILYLIFQNIAPQVKLERRWLPPVGAVLGFLLGVIGNMVVG